MDIELGNEFEYQFYLDYTNGDAEDKDGNAAENESVHNRSKRQTETYEYTPTKTRCPLLLVADYRFYQEMGASSTKTTINYLVNFKVVKILRFKFRRTNFCKFCKKCFFVENWFVVFIDMIFSDKFNRPSAQNLQRYFMARKARTGRVQRDGFCN